MVRAAFVMAALVIAAPAHTAEPLTSRIAAIQRFAAREGGKLWPGYESASFGFLLVDGGTDRLYCFPRLPDGFRAAGSDAATGCTVATRKSGQFGDNLLAAMPVFGPPSAIVMGTPQSTGQSEADWSRIILHEHFHQWQDGLSDIFQRMAALGLTGGDETGMWMLNYPFPYDEAATAAAIKPAAAALKTAVAARGTPQFRPALRRYARARDAFARAVGARNWRYAELQLWKEGVARWTEIELGKRSPDAGVRASARALERRSIDWLAAPDIARSGREFVYPYGAAEAMLLEACGPRWRERYPALLALGPLFDDSVRRCPGR